MCRSGLDDVPEVFHHLKWVCDLLLVLFSVCGTLYVCLWSIPNLPMCIWSLDVSWSVLSVLQTLSLSFLPIYSLLIHFLYISIFTSWLLILCFSEPSCFFLSSFHIHLCVLSCCCTCAWAHAHNAPLHDSCTFLLLTVLQLDPRVEKGRQEEDFPFRNRTARNLLVWVWKRSVVLEILVPWVYNAWQEVEH